MIKEDDPVGWRKAGDTSGVRVEIQQPNKNQMMDSSWGHQKIKRQHPEDEEKTMAIDAMAAVDIGGAESTRHEN